MSWIESALPVTSWPFFSLAIISAVTVVASCYIIYQRLLPRPLPGIPYNKDAAQSIWGDIPSLRNDPVGMAKWCGKQLAKHDSPITQVLMGPMSTPVVLVADVAETRDLLAKGDFDRSDYITDRFPLFGEFHLNMKTGDEWRASRSWLKDLLSPKHLYTVTGSHIHRITLDLLEVWEAKAKAAQGRPFSISADMKNTALDVIVSFYFGDDFKDSAVGRQVAQLKGTNVANAEVGPDNTVTFSKAPLHDFQKGLEDLGDKICSIYMSKWPPQLLSWWVRYGSPYYRKFLVAKDSFIRNHIEVAVERARNNEEAKTGLDNMVCRELSAAHKAQKPTLLGKQIMIDETYGNLIAGEHTTSAAMVWILKFLSENPEIQGKLRDELQSELPAARQGIRMPTAEEIINSDLPYLDAIIEETLRLRAAMLVPRDAIRDTQLLGCRIPKGTVILLVCQGPEMAVEPASPFFREQKRLRKFPGDGNPDLEVFDPERWLIRHKNGKVEFDGSSYPQLAFGVGVRACWGRKLALLEMKIMTAMATLKFDMLELPPSLSSHEGIYDISFKPLQGYVRLRCR